MKNTISNEDGVQYDYELSAAAILLNPPQALIYRMVCVVALPALAWGIFNSPASIPLWVMAGLVSWFALRAFSGVRDAFLLKNRAMSLCFTKSIVLLESNGRVFSSPKNLVNVSRGFVGINVLSFPKGGHILVRSDTLSLDELTDSLR